MTNDLLPLEKMDHSMLLFELGSLISTMKPNDAHMMLSATERATYLHRDQRRFVRNGLPMAAYIEHPLRNALRLARWGSRDSELLTIALLHDTVEDQSEELLKLHDIDPTSMTTYAMQHESVSILTNLYGSRVGEGVAMLTTNFFDDKKTYIEHIKQFVDNDDFALVKASDLQDNAGLLKHQVGAMKKTSLVRRLMKYTPAVDIMVDSFNTRPMNNEIINNASQAMSKLSATLKELNIQFDTELAQH